MSIIPTSNPTIGTQALSSPHQTCIDILEENFNNRLANYLCWVCSNLKDTNQMVDKIISRIKRREFYSGDPSILSIDIISKDLTKAINKIDMIGKTCTANEFKEIIRLTQEISINIKKMYRFESFIKIYGTRMHDLSIEMNIYLKKCCK